MALRAGNLNNLNSGSWVTSALGAGIIDNFSSLDKRNLKAGNEVLEAINIGKTIVDATSNALGLRSPYYIIGEVKASDDYSWAGLADNALGTGSFVRAVTNTKTTQEGIIIDCLGDVDGKWGVDMTTNPVFYGSTTVTDSRVRQPAELTAEVAISNYLNDNIIASAVAGAAAFAGSLGTSIANTILYNGNTRAQRGLYKLIYLMENGIPFKVYTPHGIYDNMLIDSIRVKTDDKSMEMLYATLTFKEVIMARPYYSDPNTKIPARSIITEDTIANKSLGGIPGEVYNTIKGWF